MKKPLYIHIPKTAGTSMKEVPSVKVIGFHKKACEISNINDYFSFAIIRNPYDRFLSSYYFYLNNYKNNRPIKRQIREYKDFEEFVLNFENFGTKDDLQFIPQYKFVVDDKNELIVDYIGYFDRYENEWKNICKFTGIEYCELPKKNTTTHPHWSDIYTDEMKAIVYELFKKDFEFFNFNK